MSIPKVRHLPMISSLKGLIIFYFLGSQVCRWALGPSYPAAKYFFPFTDISLIAFFLLSGFLVHYGSFLKNPWLPGPIFFIRRFRRIYPLYLLSLVFAALLMAKRLDSVELASDQILANLLLLQDTQWGGFAAPLLGNEGTWGLGFLWYASVLYFPFAYIIPLDENDKMLIAGFLAILAMLAHLFFPNPISLYFIYFPTFWAGACLARQFFATGSLSRLKQKTAFWTLVGVSLFWAFLFVLSDSGPFDLSRHPYVEFKRLLFGIIIFAAVVWAFEKNWAWEKSLRWFHPLGEIAYGIYLFQFPVLQWVATTSHPFLSLLWAIPAILAMAWLTEKKGQGLINAILRVKASESFNTQSA